MTIAAIAAIVYLVIAAWYWHLTSKLWDEEYAGAWLPHRTTGFNVIMFILCALWPAASIYALITRKGNRGRNSDK